MRKEIFERESQGKGGDYQGQFSVGLDYLTSSDEEEELIKKYHSIFGEVGEKKKN